MILTIHRYVIMMIQETNKAVERDRKGKIFRKSCRQTSFSFWKSATPGVCIAAESTYYHTHVLCNISTVVPFKQQYILECSINDRLL